MRCQRLWQNNVTVGITRSKVIVHVAVSPPFGAVAKSVWVISLGGTRLAMHFGSIVGSAKRAARTAALLQLVNNGFHSEPNVERKSPPGFILIHPHPIMQDSNSWLGQLCYSSRTEIIGADDSPDPFSWFDMFGSWEIPKLASSHCLVVHRNIYR